jgi:16S rRNA (cytosine967-C5)-methyltransferase
MIAPARVAAYEVLAAISTGRMDLPSAIAQTRDRLIDPRDQALAADIATGVQRWRAALDHLIVHFAKRPLERLDREVVEILRLSLYQLLHLSRVPASAVVDDAVKLTGKIGKRSAAGLVNAVLRASSRTRSALPLPPRPDAPQNRDRALEYLSITLSHPRWLAERWYDRLGFDMAEQWMLFNNNAAPLTLRANLLRIPPDELRLQLETVGISVVPGRFAPDALVVQSGQPLRDSRVDRGWFVVQDEASQLVALLAGAQPGRLVLDTCASPGGKTTAIAAALTAGGVIVASDVRDRRMGLLKRTVKATGASNVVLVQADVLSPLPFRTPFDCVLVDAPCSGLGTLRRDPDIRWRRRESDLHALADSEWRMLQNAAEVVAPGGRLIYATCSSEPEENEAVAARFLESAPQFSSVDARLTHPSLPATVVDDRGHFRTAPDQHGLEAFFGAVFQKLRN